MGTGDQDAEIEYLVGELKPMDKPSDDIYDTMHEAIFEGSWHTAIRSREFLEASTASTKIITG